MKINNHSDSVELSSLAKSKKSDRAAAAKKREEAQLKSNEGLGIGSTANVEISSEAKSLASAKAIAKADNIDQEKIDRIKALIQSGNYKPDFGKVADKMVNESVLQELS